jgi:hydroxyacylglutathione hydrolase
MYMLMIDQCLPLTASKFKVLSESDAIISIDMRHQNDFVKEHLPNSIFSGLEGPFDKWIQLIIPKKDSKIILVLPKDLEQACLAKINALGYTHILGYLEGGIGAWKALYKTVSINSITPEHFIIKRKNEKLCSIDIRKESEFTQANISNTVWIPLKIDSGFVESFHKETEYHLFCGGGYRSVIAISFLKKYGIFNLTNVEKGYRGITDALTNDS